MSETESQPAGAERLDAGFHDALLELEQYLQEVEEERLAALVLPFASRWVLLDVGVDVARLRDEAELLVQATPLSDRILTGFDRQVAWWVAQRMMLAGDGDERPDAERARERLASARTAIERRAVMVEEAGYPRVARGFREVAEGSAGGEPPADPLWQALALRIAESVLP